MDLIRGHRGYLCFLLQRLKGTIRVIVNLCLGLKEIGVGHSKLPVIASCLVSVILSSFVSTKDFRVQAAGKDNRISLTLVNSSFAPMTTIHGNQVAVSVKYHINDKSLENKKINGLMKIFSSSGSLIHSSSFPDGFTAKKRGGTEDFKNTIKRSNYSKRNCKCIIDGLEENRDSFTYSFNETLTETLNY